MFNKTMSDWIDSFDNDQPTSDGDCANAWSPAVWDDSHAAQAARPAAQGSAQPAPRKSGAARANQYVRGMINNG